MASVINSARTSAVSLFTAATKGADMVGDTVGIAATALDALAIKTRDMHHDVQAQSEADRIMNKERIRKEAVTRSFERDQDIIRRMQSLGVDEDKFNAKLDALNAELDKPALRVAAE